MIWITGLSLLLSWESWACRVRNRKGNAVGRCGVGTASFRCVWGGALPCILKCSSIISSLYLELARLPPLHLKEAGTIGWPDYVEGTSALRCFCPKATWSWLRQHRHHSKSLWGAPQEKRNNRWIFSFQQYVWNPLICYPLHWNLVQVRI